MILKHYTDLTGKPSLPPAYTFGLWLSTSFTTSYDEKTVTSFIDGMKDRKIPLQVFHFDCFWMKEYEWCNFEWDKDMFPDPEGHFKETFMTEDLKSVYGSTLMSDSSQSSFDNRKRKRIALSRT